MAELVSRGLVGHLGLSEVTVDECGPPHAVHPDRGRAERVEHLVP